MVSADTSLMLYSTPMLRVELNSSVSLRMTEGVAVGVSLTLSSSSSTSTYVYIRVMHVVHFAVITNNYIEKFRE